MKAELHESHILFDTSKPYQVHESQRGKLLTQAKLGTYLALRIMVLNKTVIAPRLSTIYQV